MFDRDLDGRLNRSDIVHMSSCLIDVAQFVYVSGIHMNDSPDIFADDVLQENAVNLSVAKSRARRSLSRISV